MMLLGALNCSACTSSVNDTNLSAAFTEINQSTEAEAGEIESDQMQWNVYISDDVPKHFVEVLKQYESFMNAENQENLHPLYVDFLQGRISVIYSYTYDGKQYDVECDFYDDKDYEGEHVFESASKSFALVDVNNDGEQELIFKIDDDPDKLMYIMGVGKNNELICYDVFETHTSSMSFGVQNNGIVYWEQWHTGAEVELYTYNMDGESREIIHFIKEPDSETDLSYDYYYLDGNEEVKYALQSDEEYEEMRVGYCAEEPIWYECEEFMDIPQ